MTEIDQEVGMWESSEEVRLEEVKMLAEIQDILLKEYNEEVKEWENSNEVAS